MVVAFTNDGKKGHFETTCDAASEDEEPPEKSTAWSLGPVGACTVGLVLWCRQQRWQCRLANALRYELTFRLVLWCRIQWGGGGLPDLAHPRYSWYGGQFVMVLNEDDILAQAMLAQAILAQAILAQVFGSLGKHCY